MLFFTFFTFIIYIIICLTLMFSFVGSSKIKNNYWTNSCDYLTRNTANWIFSDDWLRRQNLKSKRFNDLFNNKYPLRTIRDKSVAAPHRHCVILLCRSVLLSISERCVNQQVWRHNAGLDQLLHSKILVSKLPSSYGQPLLQ